MRAGAAMELGEMELGRTMIGIEQDKVPPRKLFACLQNNWLAKIRWKWRKCLTVGRRRMYEDWLACALSS